MKDYLKKDYDDGLDIFGLPQSYRGVRLFPLKMKDIKYHRLLYQIFANPKMYIVNRDILRMSYLKFIVYVVQSNINPNGSEMINYIQDFLTKITKTECSIEYRETGKTGFDSVVLQIRLGDVILTEEDFDDLREIILEMNGLSVNYVEDYRPDLEESLIFTQRENEGVDLRDEIFTFSSLMKISIDEVSEYTLYQFKISFEKLMILKEYDLYQPLISSGQVSLKKGKLTHYLFHSEKKGRYDSIMISKDEFLKGDIEKISA
jgi:hypothetical protein